MRFSISSPLNMGSSAKSRLFYSDVFSSSQFTVSLILSNASLLSSSVIQGLFLRISGNSSFNFFKSSNTLGTCSYRPRCSNLRYLKIKNCFSRALPRELNSAFLASKLSMSSQLSSSSDFSTHFVRSNSVAYG